MLQRMHLFFFHNLQLIPTLLSIRDSNMSLSAKFVSLRACVGFSIFDFGSFLLKFFLEQNVWTLYL